MQEDQTHEPRVEVVKALHYDLALHFSKSVEQHFPDVSVDEILSVAASFLVGLMRTYIQVTGDSPLARAAMMRAVEQVMEALDDPPTAA